MSPVVSFLGRDMFDERKVAQAAAFFLNKEGGRMAHLKLMKLLYLADRESLRQFGQPISGDEYYSLPHGPVLSKTLDLTNGAIESSKGGWDCWVSDKENHEVAVRCEISREVLDELSNADIAILELVWREFGHMTRFQIRDFTHNKLHVPEWEDPHGSARPIPLRRILEAVGRDENQIRNDLAAVESQKEISALFASL